METPKSPDELRHERLLTYRLALIPCVLASEEERACWRRGPDRVSWPEHVAARVEALAQAMLTAEEPAAPTTVTLEERVACLERRLEVLDEIDRNGGER